MLKKKVLTIFTLLAMVSMILAACGTKDNSSESKDEGGDAKKFVAGTEATFAPFESMDKEGKIVGIDVDILDAMSKELGVDFELKNVGWEPVFQQVKNGELDFGASGITITDKRKEDYDFTKPYFEATQMIVVKEDSKISSLADLKDKKVSVQINSTGHEAAKKALGETNPNISAFENIPLALMEVINGSTEAAIGDNAVVLEYLKNNPGSGLKTIEDPAFEKEYYGFMVKKGNKEMLDLLNEGLQKIKDNGKLAEITGQEIK